MPRLVETEEDAQALIEELEGGADFAELAMQNSTGPSGPSGGELGWFQPHEATKLDRPPLDVALMNRLLEKIAD